MRHYHVDQGNWRYPALGEAVQTAKLIARELQQVIEVQECFLDSEDKCTGIHKVLEVHP